MHEPAHVNDYFALIVDGVDLVDFVDVH